MQVKSIAECSLGAFCNTSNLHYAIIGLEKQTIFCIFLSCLLRQVLLYTIKFNGYPIWEVLKNNPTDRPIPVKQGRVRGNKNIFKVGPIMKVIHMIFRCTDVWECVLWMYENVFLWIYSVTLLQRVLTIFFCPVPICFAMTVHKYLKNQSADIWVIRASTWDFGFYHIVE